MSEENKNSTNDNQARESTGKTTSYFIIIFGNKNTILRLADQQTNLHIILEKKNQMGFNLLLLLKKSNDDKIK